MEFNCHGTITKDNLKTRYEETEKYGPIRLKLSRVVVDAMRKCGWVWSLDGGDLLGAYRSGKMLPHDDDFDFWVYSDEVQTESPLEDKVALLEKMKK